MVNGNNSVSFVYYKNKPTISQNKMKWNDTWGVAKKNLGVLHNACQWHSPKNIGVLYPSEENGNGWEVGGGGGGGGGHYAIDRGVVAKV